ncbi:MAG: hypothetical protein PHG16_13195 [Lachnospiraceae bacterium]|nr:hypothetical protein [Lachnospiraceae bacterium]
MDENNKFPMTPFDQTYTTQSLQILKAAIPYAPASMQKMLGIYAFATQLKSIMTSSLDTPAVSMMSQSTNTMSAQEILQDLCQYAGTGKESLENISSIFSAMQLFQMYQSENQDEKETSHE